LVRAEARIGSFIVRAAAHDGLVSCLGGTLAAQRSNNLKLSMFVAARSHCHSLMQAVDLTACAQGNDVNEACGGADSR
jgi:hypothetical protein